MDSKQQPQDASFSEPIYALVQPEKSGLPYWLSSIDKKLVPETRELLKTHSGIPGDQQSEHIHKIRDKAWAIRAYPCTGMGRFLLPFLPYSPAYAEVLSALKKGATFLDVGCHLGGEMRRLAFDGAPTDRMIGLDVVSHWNLGYELFRDRDHFKARYVEGDLMAPEVGTEEEAKNGGKATGTGLSELYGRIDIISVSAVLHQWLWEQQFKAAKVLAKFSSGPGTIVLGYQAGNFEARDITLKEQGIPQFRHNPSSFGKMWELVGQETGTKWETEAKLVEWEDAGWDLEDRAWATEGDRVLNFVVKRVE